MMREFWSSSPTTKLKLTYTTERLVPSPYSEWGASAGINVVRYKGNSITAWCYHGNQVMFCYGAKVSKDGTTCMTYSNGRKVMADCSELTVKLVSKKDWDNACELTLDESARYFLQLKTMDYDNLVAMTKSQNEDKIAEKRARIRRIGADYHSWLVSATHDAKRDMDGAS